MRLHADNPARLHRAIAQSGEAFTVQTLSVWMSGILGPRHTAKMRTLCRMEQHYGLAEGSLSAKLPHLTVYARRRASGQANVLD